MKNSTQWQLVPDAESVCSGRAFKHQRPRQALTFRGPGASDCKQVTEACEQVHEQPLKPASTFLFYFIFFCQLGSEDEKLLYTPSHFLYN